MREFFSAVFNKKMFATIMSLTMIATSIGTLKADESINFTSIGNTVASKDTETGRSMNLVADKSDVNYTYGDYSVNNAGSVGIDKRIVSFDASTGEAEIELAVASTPDEPPKKVNVVLVLDTSSSMSETVSGKTKISLIEAAANKFIDTLYKNGNKDSQVSIVSFSNAKTQGLKRDSAYVRQDWTNNVQTLKDSYKNLSPVGGTNIQSGLYLANQQLASLPVDPDVENFVVLMSDGAATSSFRLFEGTTEIRSCENYLTQGLYAGTVNYTNFAYKKDVKASDYSVSVNDNKMEFFANAAQNEANLIKASSKKPTIFTVGFDLSRLVAEDLLAVKTLKAISSNGTMYAANTEAELNKLYESLAKTMKLSHKNASVVDVIGTNFDVVQDSITPSGNSTYKLENGKIIWEIGSIPEEVTTLTYKVKVKDNAPNGILDTNESAKLSFTNKENKVMTMTFPVPSLYKQTVKVAKVVDNNPASDVEFTINASVGLDTTPFKLKHAQSTNLVFYSLFENKSFGLNVSEDVPENYELKGIDNSSQTVLMTGQTLDVVVHNFDNTVKYGTLELSKVVSGKDVPNEWSFDFQLYKKSGDTYTPSGDKITLNNTSVSSSIKLPVGEYYPKEIGNVEGFTLTDVSNATKDENGYYKITISENALLKVQATNNYVKPIYYGSVMVSKSVIGAPDNNWAFEVSLYVKDGNNYSIFEGKTVNLTNAESSKVWDNIPEGTYYVKEKINDKRYSLVSYNGAAANEDGYFEIKVEKNVQTEVKVANNYSPATITVSKNSAIGAYVTEGYTFTVTLYTFDGTNYNEYGSSKVVTAGGNVSFVDLPEGTYYVKETSLGNQFAAPAYSGDGENSDGYYRVIVGPSDTKNVEIINNLKTGIFEVKKTVLDIHGQVIADDTTQFILKAVELTTGYETTITISASNGAVEWELPFGTYKISEVTEGLNGYEYVSGNVDDYVVNGDSDSVITFVNKKTTYSGSANVSKVAKIETYTEGEEEPNVETINGSEFTYVINRISDSGAIVSEAAKGTVISGSSVNVNNLPDGKYQISEIDAVGWNITIFVNGILSNDGIFDIVDGNSVSIILNNKQEVGRNNGSVTVNKSVTGDITGRTDAIFTFVLTGDNLTEPITRTLNYSETNKSVAFYNLPDGKYTLTEVSNAGYDNRSWESGSYTFTIDSATESSSVTIDVVNEAKELGKIKVTKSFENGETPANQSFEFSLFKYDEKTKEYVDTKQTITISFNDEITKEGFFEGLYPGSYKVVEKYNATGRYEKHVDVLVDSVTYATTSDANFKNVVKKGVVNVQKQNDGVNVELAGFAFKLTNNTSNVEYSAVTDDKGIATFKNVPEGQYTLSETATVHGYALSNETMQVTVTIPQEAPVLYNFDNDKADPDAEIVKRINGQTSNGDDYVSVIAGEKLIITVEIKNTGNVPLIVTEIVDNITHTDSNGKETESSISSFTRIDGDSNSDTIDVGKTATYELKLDPLKNDEKHEDTVKVLLSYGEEPLEPKEDDEKAKAKNTGVSIVKLINGVEDTTETNKLLVDKNSKLEFEFVVKNTGEVSIVIKDIVDDILGIIAIGDEPIILEPDDTVKFTATGKAPSTADTVHHNTVTVTASVVVLEDKSPVLAAKDDAWAVTKKDTPTPNVNTASIKVEKFVNGYSAKDSTNPMRVNVGTLMEFKFKVSNTGSMPVTISSLKDVTTGGNIINIDGFTYVAAESSSYDNATKILGIGGYAVFTIPSVYAPANSVVHHNKVTVEALSDVNEGKVTDSDDAYVVGYEGGTGTVIEPSTEKPVVVIEEDDVPQGKPTPTEQPTQAPTPEPSEEIVEVIDEVPEGKVDPQPSEEILEVIDEDVPQGKVNPKTSDSMNVLLSYAGIVAGFAILFFVYRKRKDVSAKIK